MNLVEALNTIEVLKKENNKLQNRVDFLEEIMYDETMNDYDGYVVDEYDPIFD